MSGADVKILAAIVWPYLLGILLAILLTAGV